MPKSKYRDAINAFVEFRAAVNKAYEMVVTHLENDDIESATDTMADITARQSRMTEKFLNVIKAMEAKR